jgi:hypothetical protein
VNTVVVIGLATFVTAFTGQEFMISNIERLKTMKEFLIARARNK